MDDDRWHTDGLPLFDEDFVARATVREEPAELRIARAQRIADEHSRAGRWRDLPADVSSPRRRQRARTARARRRPAARAVVLAAVTAAAAWQFGLWPRDGAPDLALVDAASGAGVAVDTAVVQDFPPSGRPSQRRLLPAPPAPLGETSYRVLDVPEARGDLITWNPCEQISLTVRGDGQIDGGARLLDEAVAKVSGATGLKLVVEGTTVEDPVRERPAYQPAAYGKRWAPVLVAWSSPEEWPALHGDVAGVASVASATREGGLHWVSGQIVLDAPQLADLLRAPGGGAVVRSVILHELGHLVGLDHVQDPTQLMNASSTDTGPTDFARGDLAGLARLGAGRCE